MAQVDLPTFAGSRTRTRIYDFTNDPTRIIQSIAELICPPGTIVPILTSQEPGDGWKVCNGQSLRKDEYPRLFSIIGGSFGETPDTFRLPDLRGRVPIGADGAAALAPLSIGGAASVTLSVDQMPLHDHPVSDAGHGHTFTPTPHGHTVTDPGHAHGITDPGHTHTAAIVDVDSAGAGSVAEGAEPGNTGSATTGITVQSATTGISVGDASAGGDIGTATTGITVGAAGSGQAVPILPPYLAVYWMVRT